MLAIIIDENTESQECGVIPKVNGRNRASILIPPSSLLWPSENVMTSWLFFFIIPFIFWLG